jgi:hypothetical protein
LALESPGEVEMLTLYRCARSRLARWIALVAMVAGLLPVAAPASAVTQVYHSPGDDGVPAPGEASVPEGGVQSVYLYIDGGAAVSGAGTACDTGQGDEICGYELVLTGLGGLTLSAFNPDAAADVVLNLGAGSVLINGLDSEAPTPGPKRIGELQVNAVADGELELTSGETVGANLSEESIPTTTVVTVPEPGHFVLLGSGLAMLAALSRGRARR